MRGIPYTEYAVEINLSDDGVGDLLQTLIASTHGEVKTAVREIFIVVYSEKLPLGTLVFCRAFGTETEASLLLVVCGGVIETRFIETRLAKEVCGEVAKNARVTASQTVCGVPIVSDELT